MRTILLIALLANSFGSFAQYKLMVLEGNRWNYIDEAYITSGGGEAVTYSLSIGNDTIIDEIQYKKVINEIIYYDGLLTEYVGAMREDGVDQKVYFKPPEQKEELIYSFNHNVGDTLNIDTSQQIGGPIITIRYVKSIDQYNFSGYSGKLISISDTVYRTSPTVSKHEAFSDDWYEGIGSMKKLFSFDHFSYSVNGDTELLCFWIGDLKIYNNPDWDTCQYANYVSDLSDNVFRDKVIFYPNPAEDQIVIRSNSDREYKVQIFKTNGQLCTEKFVRYETSIDISAFMQGMYFIYITGKDYHQIEKLIIN